MLIMMYTTQLNIESESETQLEKTIDFMGTRAHKVFDKVNNNYKVSFLQNDRYFIIAEGNKVSFEDLEAFLKDIDLTRLKEIK